jgi:hypothetical protein
MRSYIPSRIMRTTTWAVLFAWLFALAAGMANACLLETHGEHGHHHEHGRAAELVLDGDAPASAPSAHHHDDEQDGKASCIKACRDTAQSTTQKSFNLALDAVNLLPQPVAAWIPAVEPVIELLLDGVQIPPEPPPRLLFARLAL